MITDADILRCARYMIRHYGDLAARRAHVRAIELRAKGQPDAAETWLRIQAAIDELQTQKPAPGERVQ